MKRNKNRAQVCLLRRPRVGWAENKDGSDRRRTPAPLGLHIVRKQDRLTETANTLPKAAEAKHPHPSRKQCRQHKANQKKNAGNTHLKLTIAALLGRCSAVSGGRDTRVYKNTISTRHKKKSRVCIDRYTNSNTHQKPPIECLPAHALNGIVGRAALGSVGAASSAAFGGCTGGGGVAGQGGSLGGGSIVGLRGLGRGRGVIGSDR
jgi:uncharacterized membrane protein YgcG